MLLKTEDGRQVRENPKVTQDIENRLTTFKLVIRRAEILGTLKDHPGWLCVKEILSEKIKNIDSQLLKFSDNEHRKNDLLMQQKTDFSFMKDMVEDFQSSVPGFESKISQYEKELSERTSGKI